MTQDSKIFNPQDLLIGTLFHLDTQGNSMLKLIKPGDVLVAQRIDPKDLSIGDIVVFKSKEDQSYITHRFILKKKKNGEDLFILKGDNLNYFDAPVSAEEIIGKIIVIKKKGLDIGLDSIKGKVLSRLFFLFSMSKFFLKKLLSLSIQKIEFKKGLQNFVLKTSRNKILNYVYRAYYILAIKFLKLIFANFREIEAIYLRRQMAKGNWQAGSSDIDLSVIIKEAPFEEEARFLKTFWKIYRALKKAFPFLGEVEIVTKRELTNWQLTKGVRAEDILHWKRLYGKDYAPQINPQVYSDTVILNYLSEAMQSFWSLSVEVWDKRAEDLYPNEFRRFFNRIADILKFLEKIDKENIPEDRQSFISQFIVQNKNSFFCRTLEIFIEKTRNNVSKIENDVLLDLYCQLISYLDKRCHLITNNLLYCEKGEKLEQFTVKSLSQKIDINTDKINQPWQDSIRMMVSAHHNEIETILSNSHVFGNQSFIVLKDGINFNDALLVYRKAISSVTNKYICLVNKSILQCISQSLFMETSFNYWHIVEQAKVDFGTKPKEYIRGPSDDILFTLLRLGVGQFNLWYRTFSITRIPTYLLYHSIEHIMRLRLALEKKIIVSSLKEAIEEYKINYKDTDADLARRLEKYLTLDEEELNKLSNEEMFYENFELIKRCMACLNDTISMTTGKIRIKERRGNARCIKPWTSLFIKYNELRVCCWAKQALANLDSGTSLRDFWNNDIAQYVRQKMLEADINEICLGSCPILNDGSDDFNHLEKCQGGFSENDKKVYSRIKNGDVIIDSKPYDIGVVIDHVCNIRCKMCFIFENPGYVVSNGFYKIVDECRDALRQVYLIGGEPFYSKRTLNFINKYINKNYKFELGFITNLTIFNRELLSKIRLNGFCVSIDGATKETYEKIRRGAKWEKVMDNLRSLVQFEKEGKNHFPIKVAFLVMTSNFREIPKAIELFEPLGVQLELPPVIRNSGDPENIFERIEYHDEFRNIIKDARKKTSQGMTLNSLKVLENILDANVIEGGDGSIF